MPGLTQLDISTIDWPLCLLNFHGVLQATEPGCILEVLVKDSGVLDTIVKIVANSSNELIKVEKEPNHIRVYIQKC